MLPEALRDKLVASLQMLTVDQATQKIVGPVTAAAVQVATATAAELEAAGFVNEANELRKLASMAAAMVPAPSAASTVQIPGIPPSLQEQLNRALQMERDPVKLRAIKDALTQLQPQTPEVLAAQGTLDALILQIETAAQTQASLEQIQTQIDQGVPAGTVAPIATPAIAPPILPTTVSFPTSPMLAGPHATIRLGSRGPDVMVWQQFLGLNADGIFGPATQAATVAFQRSKGLKADGIVGSATWGAAQASGGVTSASPGLPPMTIPGTTIPVAPITVSVPPGGTLASAAGTLAGPHATIRLGSRGPDVAVWQSFLGLKADGIFGPATQASTIAFQKSRKLTADGVVGPATWAAAQGGAGVSMIPVVSKSAPGVASILTPGLAGTHATIRQGSKGPDVTVWQTFLGLKPDGIFGPATAAATIAFQKSKRLTADGVVGPATWAAAQNAMPGSTAILNPSAPGSSPVLVSVVAPGATPGSLSGAHPTIRVGSRGTDVSIWQNFLGLKADGVFGPATQAATGAFQRAKGLSPDGVVGPATWAAAQGTPHIKPGVVITTAKPPLSIVPASFSPGSLSGSHATIRVGSKGTDVSTWQKFLGLKADGIFGPATQASTAAFQRSKGLTPDGVVGPATWAAAQSSGTTAAAAALVKPTLTPTVTFAPSSPVNAPFKKTTIRLGSKGPEVAAWQQFLRLKADGVFGPATQAATVAFQRSKKLTADGVVGPATWAAAAGGAVPAPATAPARTATVVLPTAKPPVTSTIPGLQGPHATIRNSSRSNDVKIWQQVLGVTADGIFGPGTHAATASWQKARGLTADGVVGPATWARAQQERMPGLVVSGAGHTYTVQSGDFGEKIALAFTGDKDRWPELVHANPTIADPQTGIRMVVGSVIELPESWPSTPGGRVTSAPLADGVPAPTSPVKPTDSPAVPQKLPEQKTPMEIAAASMVRNLRQVQRTHGVPGCQRLEDRSIVSRLQALAGMTSPDGLAGPGTLLTAAKLGECCLPLVMYWAPSTTPENVMAYRAVLQKLAQKARSTGKVSDAIELEKSAERERGQSSVSGPLL